MTQLQSIACCLVVSTTLLAGCGTGDRDDLFDGIDDGSGGVGARTVTQIVNDEIDNNTNETAAPIELNDLMIDDSDRSETAAATPL